MTVTLSCGSFEVDECGEFVELNASGFRLVRVSPESLQLLTPTGAVIKLRAATPILVTPHETGGVQ